MGIAANECSVVFPYLFIESLQILQVLKEVPVHCYVASGFWRHIGHWNLAKIQRYPYHGAAGQGTTVKRVEETNFQLF